MTWRVELDGARGEHEPGENGEQNGDATELAFASRAQVLRGKSGKREVERAHREALAGLLALAADLRTGVVKGEGPREFQRLGSGSGKFPRMGRVQQLRNLA